MLKAEKLAMWPEDTEQWTGFSDIETHCVPLRYWTPERAESKFLQVAGFLGIKGC